MGARHQIEQASVKGLRDDLEVFKHVAVGHLDAVGRCLKRFKLHRCGLDRRPVLIGTEVASGQRGRAHGIAVDHIAAQQAKENFSGLKEDLPPQGRPGGFLHGVARDDAVGARHELKPTGRESDVEPSTFTFGHAEQMKHVGDTFGLSDGATGRQNGHDGGPDVDALGATKRLHGQLREVGAQAHFALPVWHNRERVGFLGLRGQVRLRDPADTKPEAIGALELLEEISVHVLLAGNVTVVVGSLGDGEEDVVVHAITVPTKPCSLIIRAGPVRRPPLHRHAALSTPECVGEPLPVWERSLP